MSEPTKQMSEELDKVYEALYNDVVHIFTRYKLFTDLYDDKATGKILEIAAYQFFGELRSIILENIILLICQLMDKPEIGKSENLCIAKLVKLVNETKPGLSKETGLDDIFSELTMATADMRLIRNKFLAHNDWLSREEFLPIVMKDNLESTLKLLEKALLVTAQAFRRPAPYCGCHGNMGLGIVFTLQQWSILMKLHLPKIWKTYEDRHSN